MRRFVLVCLCLLSLGSLCAQKSYKEVVGRAMDCVLKDSLAEAETLFREALKMDPSSARNALLFSNLGTVQKRMGKTDEAIESYTMALNITPYATAILLNRAALYLDKNLIDKAYLDYCNVIDLLPENEEARLFRAYIYMQRREYKEARIDYNIILSKDLKNKTARIGLAMLDQKEGKYTAARDGLNLLIEEYPTDVSLFKMRANLETELQYPDAALLDLEEAARLDSQDAEVFLMIGDVKLGQEKKKEALAAYEKAIELGIPRIQLMEKIKQCK